MKNFVSCFKLIFLH